MFFKNIEIILTSKAGCVLILGQLLTYNTYLSSCKVTEKQLSKECLVCRFQLGDNQIRVRRLTNDQRQALDPGGGE